MDLTDIFKPGRVIERVNWHVTPRCGYNCNFCDVHNKRYEISDINSIKNDVQTLNILKEKGIQINTLNIAGGDPLLHPHFFDILQIAKNAGFEIWITTNGSLLNEVNISLISQYADGISIPLDCISNIKQRKIGRGYGSHVTDMLYVSDLIHKSGMKLGMDTLVTKLNYEDDLHSLLRRINPYKWNVYQTIPKLYKNKFLMDISVNDLEFNDFLSRHSHLRFGPCNSPIFWSKTDVKGKYFFLIKGSIKI